MAIVCYFSMIVIDDFILKLAANVKFEIIGAFISFSGLSNWSAWGSWTTCSVNKCNRGFGTQRRYRSCVDPTFFHDPECSGVAYDEKTCNRQIYGKQKHPVMNIKRILIFIY